MPEILIFLQQFVNLEGKTQHAVTYANTSNGIKIPTFFEKVGGMMLHFCSVPLTLKDPGFLDPSYSRGGGETLPP